MLQEKHAVRSCGQDYHNKSRALTCLDSLTDEHVCENEKGMGGERGAAATKTNEEAGDAGRAGKERDRLSSEKDSGGECDELMKGGASSSE